MPYDAGRLVVGCGNVLFKDDGFGPMVIHALEDYFKENDIEKPVLAMELLEKKLVATSFSLFIGYEAFGDNYFFYDKEIVIDIYNRKIPKPAKGTVKINGATNSISKVRECLLYIFDYIVDKDLLVKRINISANNVSIEKVKQLELFTDVQEIKKEETIQQVVLNIHKKYGKNSVLKGFNYQECSTTRERNRQIGGHKA